MTLARFSCCLAALTVLATSGSAAQNPTNPGQPAGSPATTPTPTAAAGSIRSMRASRASGAITIDGKLDESAWAAATPSSDFTQSYPKVGAKSTDPTEVRVLYDDAALYVGVRMFDARPDSIAAQLARRDASGIYSDWLHVMVDSYRDRRTSFRFSVNPRGVQKDVLEFDDRNGEDLNWDAVWQVATRVDSLGWTAEYRIPFSQLRFGGAQKGAERIWGFQVMRDIARRNERDSWSPWKTTDPGFVSYEGDLTGLVDVPNPSRLEVLPYVSTTSPIEQKTIVLNASKTKATIARAETANVPASSANTIQGPIPATSIPASAGEPGAPRPTAVKLLASGKNISSFGEGLDGELYVADLRGGIYKIVPSTGTSGTGGPPKLLSQTGCTEPGDVTRPASNTPALQ